MQAGCAGGCEIKISNEGDFTVATVKFYPNVKTVKVKVDRNKADYTELFNDIRKAFELCYSYKDIQF